MLNAVKKVEEAAGYFMRSAVIAMEAAEMPKANKAIMMALRDEHIAWSFEGKGPEKDSDVINFLGMQRQQFIQNIYNGLCSSLGI
jgi:hypothetical protein